VSDGRSRRSAAQEAIESLELGYGWVTIGDVASFVERLRVIRAGVAAEDGDGEPARPATAIRALHAFALLRETDDLVGCDRHLGRQDAVTVLATAALYRPVEDAVALAIRQRDVERGSAGGETPLTDGIVHDVVGQRIALEVAAFIRRCWPVADGELGTRALRVFARRRTNRDKAVLYIALRDEGCEEAAAILLRLSLDTLADDVPAADRDADPAEFHDLVGALYQLSPSERILETWIDRELRSADQWTPTIELVVNLVTSHRTGPDYLVEYIGRRLAQPALISVCERLYRRSPQRCAAVRAHIALRAQPDQLATIVRDWHKSRILSRTTRELLADLVCPAAGPEAGLRSLDELDELSKWLHNKDEIDLECGQMLWLVVAEHIEGRSGADLVGILRRIQRRRDRLRAARRIAEWLAARVHHGRAEDRRRFLEYFVELRGANESDAAYIARRQLGEPPDHGQLAGMNAPAVAGIAVDLYRGNLTGDAWDLLERCLENEQGLRADDVAAVVESLHASPMPPEDRLFLLRATVGRWTDAHHRDAAVALLRRQRFDTEADHVILSLR
jgi:hypothetical protein